MCVRTKEQSITNSEPFNEPMPDRMSDRSSVALILGATVISGIAGYLVTWSVARAIGPQGYAVFAVFWSALFLIVGVLFGLQQESTRATAARTTDAQQHARSSLWLFAAVIAVIVVIVVLGTSIWWAAPSLGSADSGLAWQIALGSGVDCIVAMASGVMAGSQLWRHLAAIVALDGVLRATAVFVVLSFTHDVHALAWAVIAPFPLSLLIVFAVSPRALISRARVALSYGTLIRNSSQTMLAASATALLINGFPLILSFFSGSDDKHILGALILAVTLTRAPILVPLMALQSYLVTRFSLRPEAVAKLVVRLLALIAVIIGLLAFAAALIGTQVMSLVFGAGFALPPSVLAPLVASSGLIGALCVTGPAVLARQLHAGYAIGWVVASIVAIFVLFLPVQLETRTVLALSIGPFIGLCVHIGFLVRGAKVGSPVTASSLP
jgi:O-antigen/teichoic acid export membrane protein